MPVTYLAHSALLHSPYFLTLFRSSSYNHTITLRLFLRTLCTLTHNHSAFHQIVIRSRKLGLPLFFLLPALDTGTSLPADPSIEVVLLVSVVVILCLSRVPRCSRTEYS